MIVTLPYDPAWKALEWAKEHCPDYVTNEVRAHKAWVRPIRPIQIDYFFSSERDAVFFSLRWV